MGGERRGGAWPDWLVVDAMNVIGSRPDGWWRDRAGAVRRLRQRLVALADAGALEVTLVVDGEGDATGADEHGVAASPPRAPAGVTVVYAGRGRDAADDRIAAIVAATRRDVTVVTADRALRERSSRPGASHVGPRWLLDRLDALSATESADPPARQ